MPSRWIGEVASESGLSTLDVVRLLALQGLYPYSGYLDEQHVTLVRARRADIKGRDVLLSQTKRVPPVKPYVEEKSSITSPIASLPNDGSEEKTMILPSLNPES